MSNKESEQPLIQLSATSWSKEQKLSIARIAGQALTSIESIVQQQWGMECWFQLLAYLELSQQDLVAKPMTYEEAAKLLSSGERDIRIEILVDLLAVAMHLNKQPSSQEGVIYDARSRRFLFELARLAALSPADVTAVERSVAQQMYFALQENTKEKDRDGNLQDRAALMDQSAQKKIEETNKEKKAFKWLATGAGVLGGGALIALTGGLAAPLLAPLLAGLTGATFFATAGGVALMTSLFGLTGNEFYLWTPWEHAFARAKNYNDIYCLQYESDPLMDLGLAFDKFVKNQAIRYAGVEVAKQTALRAFFSAVALPATLLKIADVIDNPWQIAADRSKKAGVELYERKKFGLIDHVVFMGAPISGEDTQLWKDYLSVVSGRCVNCFTDKDWVLAFVYRLHSLDTDVAGLQPVKNIPRLENIRLDLEGHTSYRDAVADILTDIGMA
ncbi:hypothetical protein BDA99DRAFT_548304 [Phascolomyces articulosus]|uniref:Uncharacterized protein n=1 Tax=Phascolomyces articulosus TaxID=60185 RepID=A0AAD5JTD8_9FUNG|nr:hypothetical protein BDA99DRAFT_548304 [Phascolomyces articulosus]